MNCSKQPSETAVPFFLTPFVVLGPRPGIQASRGSRGTNGPPLNWPHQLRQ